MTVLNMVITYYIIFLMLAHLLHYIAGLLHVSTPLYIYMGFWDPTGITLALVKTQGINCTYVPSKSLIRLRICSCFPIDVMPNSLRHERSIIFTQFHTRKSKIRYFVCRCFFFLWPGLAAPHTNIFIHIYIYTYTYTRVLGSYLHNACPCKNTRYKLYIHTKQIFDKTENL